MFKPKHPGNPGCFGLHKFIADKDEFNGLLTDSNIINSIDMVRLLYADVYTSRFNTSASALPTLDALNTSINNAADNSLILFYE